MTDTPKVTPDDDAAPDPLQALHAMVHSPGFALFLEHVRKEYGNAAQIRKVKDALHGHPASEHSVLTQSILGTAEAVIELFSWPEKEIERLRQAAREPKPAVDQFAQHRRVNV